MANTRIGRTVSVAGDKQKATFSAWIKRTGLSEAWLLSSGGTYSSGSTIKIGFNSSDNCFIVGPSNNPRMESTRKFRDTNAWYHYVVAFDTTQSTASDRLKFYINGELITDYGTETYPTLNQNLPMNQTGSDNNMWLGGRGESTYEFNGIMSHVHWCDGYVYDASAFGSTDATTGEWKINTSPSVTYGTNGYFMLKDGNSLTDASGNGNNFTSLVGTLTNTEDNPSNVFATMNPLDNYYASSTFSNGNTTTSMATSGVETFNASTIGVSSGKYYSEVKVITVSSRTHIGVVNKLSDAIGNYIGQNTYSYAYAGYDGNKWNNGDGGSWGNTYTTNDIIGIAMDLDNNKIYFSKNGAWQNSGDPTSGSTGTGSMYNLTASSSTPAGAYFFAGGKRSNDTVKLSWNFGNGYFGTTAVSSAGTNASGIGIFEYDVPTGYTALSTK